MSAKLTQERLKELLHYDPETGEFTWQVDRGRMHPGDTAGTPHNMGYVALKLYGRRYLRHRLAFLYMTGEWPLNVVDHKNGVRGDDRYSNLRQCTMGENHQNKARNMRSKSGLLGVSWNSASMNWKAQIKVSGRCINLGDFSDPGEAHGAYLSAKARYHTFNPVPREEACAISC